MSIFIDFKRSRLFSNDLPIFLKKKNGDRRRLDGEATMDSARLLEIYCHVTFKMEDDRENTFIPFASST